MLEVLISSQARALQELLAARCATCRQRAMLHGYSTKTTQNFANYSGWCAKGQEKQARQYCSCETNPTRLSPTHTCEFGLFTGFFGIFFF